VTKLRTVQAVRSFHDGRRKPTASDKRGNWTPFQLIGYRRCSYCQSSRSVIDIAYGGYVTIEQERDPRNTRGVLADLAASRDFLRRAGF
jgi:hypothetical protein